MILVCNLGVLGIAGTPQGSILVMTDADWAGDVKDRRSYSRIAVCVKGSAENTWCPFFNASSTKQNMVFLSSGESELMALVGGACEGNRIEGPMEQDVPSLSWYCCPVHRQCSSVGLLETQGCKSTHSPRGYEGLLHASLGNGAGAAHPESAW